MDKIKKMTAALLAVSAMSVGMNAQAFDMSNVLDRVVDNVVWSAGNAVSNKVSNKVYDVVNGTNNQVQTQQQTYEQYTRYDEQKFVQELQKLDPASAGQLMSSILAVNDSMSMGNAQAMESSVYQLQSLNGNRNRSLSTTSSMAMDVVTNGSFNNVSEMTYVAEGVLKQRFQEKYVDMLIANANTNEKSEAISQQLVDGFATDHLPSHVAKSVLAKNIDKTNDQNLQNSLKIAIAYHEAHDNIIDTMKPGQKIQGKVFDDGVLSMGEMIVIQTKEGQLIGINPSSVVNDRGVQAKVEYGKDYTFQGSSNGLIQATSDIKRMASIER